MNDPVFDTGQAFAEGWSIFDCDGSANGRWQLQKVDESDEFDSDLAAWQHVVKQARSGSQYHINALDFLLKHNRLEHDTVVDTVLGKAVA